MAFNNVIPFWLLEKIYMREVRQRAADWHGVQAMKAYRRKDYPAYLRHTRIAESLWKEFE
jgi:hypothetical protein